MKKVIIGILVALVVLVIVAVLAVTLFLDSGIKKGVETFGPQVAKVDVKLDGVSLSLLSGSGSLKGLVVGNPEGYKTPSAISVGRASLAISPGSLLSDKIVVKSIRVEAPEITFEGGFSENNLTKIMANVNAATGGAGGGKPAEPPKQESAPGKKLQVDDFLITGAKVNVSLTGMGGKAITVPLPDIHLTGLGQGTDGITAGELTKRVLNEVLASATKVATSDAAKNLTKGVTDAAKDAGKTASDAVEKATKGLGGLFKKQ
ncbi:MAG TPA: hypothetical protein VI136_11350 [Verrucomicrobiae bacterium]